MFYGMSRTKRNILFFGGAAIVGLLYLVSVRLFNFAAVMYLLVVGTSFKNSLYVKPHDDDDSSRGGGVND